jgi:hypothetical protein
MTWEYSEDNLIEQTAIDLFFNQLGWDTLLAYNKEGFGEGSTLGRLNKKEVVLKKIFRGVNLVTYFNLFITNVFRFHKSFNDSMKDSLLMN